MNYNQTSISEGERSSSPTDQASANISNTEKTTTEPVQLGAAPLLGPDGMVNRCAAYVFGNVPVPRWMTWAAISIGVKILMGW